MGNRIVCLRLFPFEKLLKQTAEKTDCSGGGDYAFCDRKSAGINCAITQKCAVEKREKQNKDGKMTGK